MRHMLILGGGTGGTIMANKLASALDEKDWRITVVDETEDHYYQPGFLFVPFGTYRMRELVKPRRQYFPGRIKFILSAIDHIEPENKTVILAGGDALRYDVLIIATGADIHPEQTEGLLDEEWGKSKFDFYTPKGADKLAQFFKTWQGGRLVLSVTEMPIKCPVAPLEFLFLADAYFTKRGMRDKVEITYATPLDGAFTKPVAAKRFGHLLQEKGINLVTEFNAGSVDTEGRRLLSWDEREVPFDLLVTIPAHKGASFIAGTPGLGNDMNFVLTNPFTLQARCKPNLFAIGDATDVPTSKAGSVAHFEAEVLTENVRRFLAGEQLDPAFDGHANCFIETGFDKALLIDFNYDVEPHPGRFPMAVLGPMTLMEESRLNHLGKLAFKWVYWNLLLPGYDIPGIQPQMSMRGKQFVTTAELAT